MCLHFLTDDKRIKAYSSLLKMFEQSKSKEFNTRVEGESFTKLVRKWRAALQKSNGTQTICRNYA